MNYPQNQEQSPRQAGAWRSRKERQAPAWPLDDAKSSAKDFIGNLSVALSLLH